MPKLTAIVACAFTLALLAPRGGDGRGRQTSTLKNIKVLTDLSDQQIDDAMMYFRGSLGVQCEHCHDRDDWSLDTKEEKRTAREMIKMGEASAEENIKKIKSLLPFFADSCKVRLTRKGRKTY